MIGRHGARLALAASLAAGLMVGAASAQPPGPPGGAPPPQAPPRPDELPVMKKIRDNVYVIENRNAVVGEIGRFGSNVGVILTPEGVILVDTKVAAMHDDVVQKVRSLTNLPIKYVILTHNHPDHAGGAQAMQALGATLIISDEDRQNMARNGVPGLPQITYTGRAKLFLGGVEVQLSQHRGHTRGDTAVYLPHEKILFGGDLVDTPETIPMRVAYNDGGTWSDMIRSMGELAQIDFETLVGGHGPELTKAQYMAFKAKHEGIVARFRQLNRDRKSAQEIGETLQREFGWGGQPPGSANIPAMMEELR